ncbi:hypothetical protein CsatB_013576 [Cannabis sativa]
MAPTDPTTRHVAVLAFPFGTHAAPLLTLVRDLSAAAPDAVFSFFSTSRSNKTLFSSPSSSAEETSKVVPYDIGDGTRDGSAAAPTIETVDAFLNAVPGNFERGLVEAEKVVGVKIGCLVSDAFFWFAGEMAGERRIPWVPLWTSGPRSLLSHLYTDHIRRRFEDPEHNKEDQTLNFLPEFSSFRVTDLPLGIIIPPRKSESPFDIMLHKMAQTLPKANAVVINSFHQIDSQISTHLKTQFHKFLNLGPFTLTNTKPNNEYDPNNCLEWLSRQNPRSVVYISFGSLVVPHADKVAILVEALKESGFSFLWSYRGENNTTLFEETLNGKLVSWAPQVEVLKHPSVGAFVTHCGWNSILESIVGGVPMICCPFFGDQMMNMRTIEDVWGIGVGVEGVASKHDFLKALRSVLVEEEGKGMRERIGVMKKLAYEAVTVDDNVVDGGSSRRDFNDLVEIITKG